MEKFKPQQKRPTKPEPEAVFEIHQVNRDQYIVAESPFRVFTGEDLASDPFITLEEVSEPGS